MKKRFALILVAIMTVLYIGGRVHSETVVSIDGEKPEGSTQEREENMAAGDKLVNLEDLKATYDDIKIPLNDIDTEISTILEKTNINTCLDSLVDALSTTHIYFLSNPVKKGFFVYGFDWYAKKAGTIKYYLCTINGDTAKSIYGGTATSAGSGKYTVRFNPIIADEDLYLGIGNDSGSTGTLIFKSGNTYGDYGTKNYPIIEAESDSGISTTGVQITRTTSNSFAYGVILDAYIYADLSKVDDTFEQVLDISGSAKYDYRPEQELFTNSGILNPANGNIKTASGYYTTDYMDFTAYKQYTGTGFPAEYISSFTTFCIYDGSKTFIQCFNGDINILASSYPSAKYFRVSADLTDFNKYYIVCHPYGVIKGQITIINQTLERIGKGWLPKGLQLYPNMLRYYEIDDKIGFIGRWYKQTVNNKECFVTNNCGSEFYFKVSGASAVTIDWEAMTETNAYYVYVVDDGSPTRANITSESIPLPDSGTHYVRIITDGITENIGKWENGTGFAFSGVTVSSGKISGVLPANPQIMFFGDSITEGIRALGIDDTDMGNTNSATGAFPWYCCEVLKAIPFRIGYGATGINQVGSFNKAIYALEYLYDGVPVGNYYPDAIVINYGQNDTDGETFRTKYTEYLNAMHIMYPGVKVYVMIPFSQRCAESIRTVAAGCDWVTVVETSTWTGITYADGTHPLAAGAQVAGEDLANVLIPDIYGE